MKSSKGGLLTAAMIVAGIRIWMQIRGKAKTPFSEWAVGWGATFFVLALLAEAAPQAANGMALLIAFSDFLVNGQSLTNDLSGIVAGQEQGKSLFVDQPFQSASQSGTMKGGAGTLGPKPAATTSKP